jgi:hypothetical protein
VPTSEATIEPMHPSRLEKKTNTYVDLLLAAARTPSPSTVIAPSGIGRQQPPTRTCVRRRGRPQP